MALPRRAFLWAILALLLFAAIWSWLAWPTASPAKPLPALVVEATYPGASAQVLADTVAAPVEQQVNGVEGLRQLCSQCTDDGRYTLQVIFNQGTDLNIAQVLVQNRVSLAEPLLPDAAKRAGLTVKKKSPGVLLFVVLYSPDGRYDNLYLSNYASIQIKDELARVAGVGDVTLFGGQDYGLRVWLDPDRLAARNLTTGDVVKALESQNAQVTGGPGAPYTVHTLGRLADIDQFGDIVLKTGAGGQVVRLKDVARLELGGDASRHFAQLDGRPAAALGVFLLPQARPRGAAAAVRARMEELKKAFPEGLDYSLAFDLAPVWEAGDRAAPGYLLVEPSPPSGLSAERALRLVDRCGAILAKTEGVQHVLALSEDPFTRFGDGPCLLAQLAPDTKRADREGLLRAVRGQFGQVEGAKPRLRELTGPGGYPVDFALRGPEAKDVREFGARLAERLARTGKLTDLAVRPAADGGPHLVVDVDRYAAKERGISTSDILSTLEVYLGAVHVRDFNRFGRTWQVQAQVEGPGRDRAEGIKRLKVRNEQGEMVPLSGLVTVREETGGGPVDRLDFEPMAEITANPAPGVSPAEARWLCETLAEKVRASLQLSPAYALVWMQELPGPKPMPGAEKDAAPDPPPPEVRVSKPVVREVTDYEVFTGRTQAVETVDLRARVTGYLVQTPFKEGTDVKKGQVLFEIDPRPYQAELERGQGQLQVAGAALKLARTTYERDQAVAKSTPGVIGAQQLDQDRAAVEEAQARVKAAQAGIDIDKLNLDFTRVASPIDGRIGRHLVDPGNLVKADDTLLATVVSRDPMYVYFDIDERTVLRLRHLAQEGKIQAPREGETPVWLGLAGEKGYPRKGAMNFTDNQVNPETGTLRARAVFPNADRLLSPGLFARVRVPVGAPHKALLVPEAAVGDDEGQKYVYVVNDKGKVVSRPVTPGAEYDGLRAVESGLQPDERVIVRGVQKVRPGMTVRPREEVVPSGRGAGPR